MAYWGGIEAGGTKFVCGIADDDGEILKEVTFPTESPGSTTQNAVDFFQEHREKLPLTAIGIASFGPLDLNHNSPTYGHITSTPKPGWSKFNLVYSIQGSLQLPIGFDTDVNAAALGEFRWGAAQGLDTFIYLTIGTGIGGGAMVNHQLLHGLLHAEMGHMRIPHDWNQDPYPGFCPFHGDCLEGLASGPAIEDRWGQSAENLPAEHPAWELEANYLAFGLVNILCVLSPQRIILGGGVMHQSQLFPMIGHKVQVLLNDYLNSPILIEQIDEYIVPPGLGDQAGLLGAIALAQHAENKS
jgi:fructokinase